jgi:hypothetical protein
MIGYDSNDFDQIPTDAQLVMPYNDGEGGTATPEQLARLNHAIQLPITRRPGIPAVFVDIEPGCVWPMSVGVQMYGDKLVKGLYVALSNWSALRTLIFAAKLPTPPYWVAAYPDPMPTDPIVPTDWIALGAVMWQFAAPTTGAPGHYDLSVTAPGFPFVVAKPRLNRRLLIGQP